MTDGDVAASFLTEQGAARREQPGQRGVCRAAGRSASVPEDDGGRPVGSLLPERIAGDPWPSTWTSGCVSRSAR